LLTINKIRFEKLLRIKVSEEVMMDEDEIRYEGGEKLPNQKELEKELSDYLSKKYGNRIKIISPFVYPKAQEIITEEGRPGEKKEPVINFDMLPEELESHLDSFVVKQNQAKAYWPPKSALTSTASSTSSGRRTRKRAAGSE